MIYQFTFEFSLILNGCHKTTHFSVLWNCSIDTGTCGSRRILYEKMIR